MKNNFTPISELGRYKLLKRLTEAVQIPAITKQGIIKGIGDDCAVISSESEQFVLQSTETYVEGVDFDLTYSPLPHLGYKLVSAALSDIYAMNGRAESMLVNVGIPNKISAEMVEKLYSGIIRASEVHNCLIIGGDITASPGSLIITITVNGRVKEESITYRSGANVSDAICVTGDLGAAYAGLRVLLREKNIWSDREEGELLPDLTEYEYVVKRQLLPEARNDLIQVMEANDIVPSSMIDISKNFLQDLMQLVTASDKGALIYEAALPIAIETRAIANEFEENVDQYALQGGEDYELIFTLPESDVNKLVNHFKDFVVVGKVTSREDGVRMQTSEGDEVFFDTSEME